MSELDLVSILSRDTIDVDAVNETLRKSSIVNFQTLYDIEKSLVNVQRYDVPFSEFKQVKRVGAELTSSAYPRRHVTYLSHDMVKYDRQQAFRESGYYNKQIDQETISELSDIFRSNYFVFADGKFLNTAEVICTEGEVTLVIDIAAEGGKLNHTDGIPYSVYRELLDTNAIISIIFVPNYKYSKAEFNLPTLNKWKGDMKYPRFTHFEDMTEDTIFFMNKNTDQSMGIQMNHILYEDGVKIPNYEEMESVRMSLHGITLPFMKEIIKVSDTDNWFMTSDEYNLPLPTNNIIPMDAKTGEFVRGITFDHFYPNMYRVNGIAPHQEIDLYIFYKETNDEKYTNDLELLKYISDDLVDMYKKGKIPDRVKDYKPLDVKWFDTKGFKDSIYFPNKVHFSIAKLQDYIERDPNIWLRYLYAKLRDNTRYYINMAKLSLDERLRNDTLKDNDPIGDGDSFYFNEPHYVFSMRKKFVGGGVTEFRLFLDNILLPEDEFVQTATNDFYNFYIPARMVTPTSMLEVEKIKEYTFIDNLGVFDDVNKIHTITIPSNIGKLHVGNIELITADSDQYVSHNDYKIFAYSDIVEQDIELAHSGHAMITKEFKIQIIDEKLIGEEIKVILNHSSGLRTFKIGDVVPESFSVLNTTNMNSTNTRMFVNGLCLPVYTYRVLDRGYYGKPVRVMTGIPLETGDKVTVDALPHDYTCDYFAKTINNEYGLVDTGNELRLPFDLKWYDVYVNGRKLNKNNIEVITTSKFFIKGVDSLKNLYIFFRDTAATEFYGDHKDSIQNYIYDNIEELREAILEDKDIIEDTLEDIVEGFLPGLMDFYSFVQSVLQYIFINPNIQQLDENIAAEYPTMFDENMICWLDCNTYPDAEAMEFINSNVRSEDMKQDQYRYGFTPLHIGAHDDAKDGEYMCDPVTGAPGMRMADGTVIASGSLDRLATHKDRFATALLYGNMGYASVYNVEPKSGIETAREVVIDADVLEEPIELGTVSKFRVSLDIAVLKAGGMGVLGASDYNPRVKINYTQNGVAKEEIFYLGDLAERSIAGGNITIQTIKVLKENDTDDLTGIKMILYSILIAF